MSRYDVSKHAAAGQAALKKKLKKKGRDYATHMAALGATGRRKQLAAKKKV